MSVMKPLYTATRTLSVATALTVIFAGSAYALDGNDVAKRLQARFEEQGAKIEFSKVDTDGSTITLRDTKIDFKTPEVESIAVGDVVLSDVAEDGKGGYTAESATLQDIEKKDDKSTFVVKGIEIGKIHLASDDEQDPVVKMMYYQTMKADSLTVSEDGQEMVNMKDLYASSTPYTKGTPISVNFGVKSIDLDIEKMDAMRKKAEETADAADADATEETAEDTATPNPLLDLGYKKLSMVVTSTAAWEPEKGDFSIDKMEFDVKDVGKLDTTMKLGGYDVKFIKAVQQASAELNSNKENSDAVGMAMLGLIQQLSVSDLSIRYDDSSLTPKLLEYYAKQQGISSEDMVNQIKGIAPLMVGYLGHADFAMQATTAVNTYFDDPKSLTIAAKPEAPVSFALIAATATADPKKLLDLLAVKLTANQ
ncbi:hypothetical protein P8H26_04005 [Pseudochrobactrum sp. sp1633]|uniref:hypothetical protein n=1 Tax=Pseudochrobactrum sp. sp1633 TaxID=3036706 RepID=UPI0025A4FBC0|nr:hypothetical protein [Pseudochrobactrum sp. sp1633]MDM8344553.1 hypothetical protein [Pseudochrobactrum sp. sp1633]HWD13686.1 hypothetical protein [Pseudochrobactrum sp.]